ncbi:MAG: sensor histidine kinase [Ruminococcaceae bacterium]|nr:sensor histidine kinase [Oscillospiraceae bacterium]
MRTFLTSLLSWGVLVPAAALCIAPMRHRLRFGMRRTILCALALFAVLLPLTAWLELHFQLPYNALLAPILLLSFGVYHDCLTVHISKSLSVFTLVCSFLSFFSNFANGYDVILNPHSTLDNFSIEAAGFQLALFLSASSLLLLPMAKYGARLIDSFEIRGVWYVTIPVDAIFLGYNLLISPREYETMMVNRVFLFYWLSLVLLLSLLLLLCVLFYNIVDGMMLAAETETRNRVLEMQESQYLKQQHYMEATAEERHNFKQSVRTMRELAEAGDLEALRRYLDAFGASIPSNDVLHICDNRAVNALLNYYAQAAKREGVELNYHVELPERVGASEVDLCGMIGNLLDNAMYACRTLPEGKRWAELNITMPHAGMLCILTSNSFDGTVRRREGRYLSTRHGGIGLASVTATAERYDGEASFRHEGNVFYCDVALLIGKAAPEENSAETAKDG